MTGEEKAQFISNCKYFYHEKGEMERYVDFSMERLEDADPTMAFAYRNLKQAEEVFERVIGNG